MRNFISFSVGCGFSLAILNIINIMGMRPDGFIKTAILFITLVSLGYLWKLFFDLQIEIIHMLNSDKD